MNRSSLIDSVLKLAPSKAIRTVIIVIATAAFLVISAHTPIEIRADAIYDDALYITLGKHIAAGKWLGAYTPYTLMKGPGYSLFLAVNAWLGLPIGLSHAAFQCLAIGFFFWVFARISNMPWLAVCGFLIALWAPAPYFARITRGAIYPGETLLVLGAIIYTLLATLPKGARIKWGLLSGLLYGWFVLTREEGIWLTPGIAVIIAYAGWASWRKQAFVFCLIAPLTAMVISFAITQNVFSHLNQVNYGRNTGVETTGAPFKNTLAALQSVDVGTRIPYVPVSRQARFAIYAISPSFRTLKDYFDGPGGTPWQYGCHFYPETCGDIAGGWFLWALRDAAASRGIYSSPVVAAQFYRAVTREIKQACSDGRLKCAPTLFALLPHISHSQWKQLPSSLLSGIRQISLLQRPDIQAKPSSGYQSDMISALEFLGNPVHTASPKDTDIYRIEGWFYSPSHDWITGQLTSGDQTSTISIARLDSPNLINAFNDSGALHQRFDFEISCATPCNFKLIDKTGASLSLNLAHMVGQKYSSHLGASILNIDQMTKYPANGSSSDMRTTASIAVRSFNAHLFSVFMPWLAAAAAVAILLVGIIALFTRRLTKIDAIAVAIWGLLLSRLFLLGIIDISSFPGMTSEYLAPAYVLICIAIPTSFAALYTSGQALLRRRAKRADGIDRVEVNVSESQVRHPSAP